MAASEAQKPRGQQECAERRMLTLSSSNIDLHIWLPIKIYKELVWYCTGMKFLEHAAEPSIGVKDSNFTE